MVISTGKSDWEKEVTDAKGSLAAYLASAQDEYKASPASKASKSNSKVPGVFSPDEASRVSVLNGSHRTVCEDQQKETVLVFPDYKVVVDVERSSAGAEDFWKTKVVDPPATGPERSETGLRSWIIPYSCVIMLCEWMLRLHVCRLRR